MYMPELFFYALLVVSAFGESCHFENMNGPCNEEDWFVTPTILSARKKILDAYPFHEKLTPVERRRWQLMKDMTAKMFLQAKGRVHDLQVLKELEELEYLWKLRIEKEGLDKTMQDFWCHLAGHHVGYYLSKSWNFSSIFDALEFAGYWCKGGMATPWQVKE